jgi:hypothetical protein
MFQIVKSERAEVQRRIKLFSRDRRPKEESPEERL